MRIGNIFFLILASMLLLCSCGNEQTEPAKRIKVDSVVNCTYNPQSIEIKFSLEGANGGEKVSLSVAKSGKWIENTSIKEGSIIVTVSENSGEARTTTLTLSSAGYSSATIKLTQHSQTSVTAPHTLMFYFFGTSLGRFFTTNIDDAKLAIKRGALGKHNRMVYFRQHNANDGYIAEVCYDKATNSCYESIIEDHIAIEGNPIDPEYISQTINKMAAIAPAKRYGLVMAGHGHAWLTREYLNGGSSAGVSQAGVWTSPFTPAPGAEITRAFGERNVQVNSAEIAEGIEGSNIDIDYILFDACFMSSIEVAYELRNSANYIIASPCEIMGRGFPYERTLPHLFKNDGATTDYIAAAESYYRYYRDEYTSSQRCGSIAVYECSELEALRDATKEIVKSAKSDYNIDAIQTYEGQNPHYFYDFGQWAEAVATDNAAYQNFKTQLDKTIIAKYTLDTFYSAYGSYGSHPINVEAYSGLTTSAPSSKLETEWQATEWYKSVWQL